MFWILNCIHQPILPLPVPAVATKSQTHVYFTNTNKQTLWIQQNEEGMDINEYILFIMLNSVVKLTWQWKGNWAGCACPSMNIHRFGQQ
jgi:hypothetical protein